jgi:hypothetical protein
MKNRNVAEMTRGELFRAVNDESKEKEPDLAFIKACIKEEDKRKNKLVQEFLQKQREEGSQKWAMS